jgi:hypothetical protein
MAHGEVVVVNEKFGIRLTNIISPGDRVKGSPDFYSIKHGEIS